ncbi:hypothetical protein ACH4Y0_35835 [Streptomyces sp. NPDC020707]|uniref:Transcriptional regulator n=1 Tax=Streptomyces ortus TaxID=2867268 RepID=A0ABT3VHR8_9ACTN|nr:hypothetical protein [Streptomyces ortus]MCX4237853.1 hypothetical protein [Streptomyces ortus]
MHHLLNLCRTETDPERRSFLAKTAYAVTTAASALPDFGALPVEGRKEPTGIQVATCDVEALKEMTQTFATLADRHGGAHVRAMLASYLADQVGRLLHAPANGALHNDLLRGAGQLTHLLALTNDDSGHPGLAQRYFRTALDLATRAGDARLYAITLRALSAQALRLGHLRHALQLAEASISALPAHADPAPRAFLLAQRAYAGAAHGDRRRAPADLALAEEHHAQATAATGPFNTYPRAGLDYQRAQTLHALGLPDQALAALQSSARHRSPDERKPAALTHARLAEMQLDMGHVDAAVIHGHLFLDLCPYLHSTRIDTALQRLRQHLARYPRQRQAVTLAERLRDACRVRRGSFRT